MNLAAWNAAQDRARRSYDLEPFAGSTCGRCAQGVHSWCTDRLRPHGDGCVCAAADHDLDATTGDTA